MSKIIIEPTWPEGGSFPVIDGKSYVSIIDARRVMDAEVEKARNAALEKCGLIAHSIWGNETLHGNKAAAESAGLIFTEISALKYPEGGR